MISLLITLFLFMVAAASWAIMSHYTHHAEVLNRESWWGKDSWIRKYKLDSQGRLIAPPKNNLYYKIFKIDYVERFPLSATLLVFVTDYWHFFRWLMVNALCAAFTTSFWGFLMLWTIWHLVFTITYTILKK